MVGLFSQIFLRRRTFLMYGFSIGCGLVGSNARADGLSIPSWVSKAVDGSAPLFSLDAISNRGWFNGKSYASEEAFLVAVGGIRAVNLRTFTPKVVGTELMVDPHFDSGITADGWVVGSGSTGNGALSYDAANKALKLTALATGQTRFGAPKTPGGAYKGYRFAAVSKTPANGWGSASLNSRALDANLTASAAAALSSVPVYSAYVDFAQETATFYSGANFNFSTSANGNYGEIDDVSVKEVVPYEGFVAGQLSGRIRGTTPPAASGNKVVLQFDGNEERNRVRIVWDSTKHLRLIVTMANAEQANLDLGIVETSTDFDIRFSCASNAFSAWLEGGPLVTDTSGTMPGLACLRIGGSFTGEAWDGTLGQVDLWPTTQSLAPLVDTDKTIAVYGDSTAAGAGASSYAKSWYWLLYTSYAPLRSGYQNATGGQAITTLANIVTADTDHRKWTTIFYDRHNTGETADLWMEQIARAVAHLQTPRFLIMPQVAAAEGGDTAAFQAITDEINVRIKATYPNNTFDAALEAQFLAELDPASTRVDGVHRNDIGQAIEKTYIRNWLDGKGW